MSNVPAPGEIVIPAPSVGPEPVMSQIFTVLVALQEASVIVLVLSDDKENVPDALDGALGVTGFVA